MAAKAKKPISVVERRLKSGSIFAGGAKEIPLADPARWTLRIVNAQIREDRLWEMQAEKGWVYADERDLAVAPTEVGFRVQDGRLVRGVQGHEVLMKMERSDYKAIQKAKDAENRVNTFAKEKIKGTVIAQASAELGDQAASYLNQNLGNISVTDSRELVNLESE
jgi:hypothetical protein